MNTAPTRLFSRPPPSLRQRTRKQRPQEDTTITPAITTIITIRTIGRIGIVEVIVGVRGTTTRASDSTRLARTTGEMKRPGRGRSQGNPE